MRSALKTALQEAAEQKNASRLRALNPLMSGGADYDVLTAATSLAKQGLAESRDKTFSDVMEGINEEQKIADARRKESLGLLETFAKDGTLGEMSDDALLEIGKSAGLSEGLVLAWKARIAKAAKVSDQMAALEVQKINSEIAENYASAGKSSSEAKKLKRQPSAGFSDIDTEDDVRSDIVSYKSDVSNGVKTDAQALQELRTLYNENDVDDDTLLRLWGVQSIGSEDIDQQEESMPGSFSGGSSLIDRISDAFDPSIRRNRESNKKRKEDIIKQFNYYKNLQKTRTLTKTENDIVSGLRNQARSLGINL